MSEPRFRLKPGGLVEITSGISCFEIINLANRETVGGNVTHYESVRFAAMEYGINRMLETDDEDLDGVLSALGYDAESGELLGVVSLTDADLEAALDAAEPATLWRAELSAELNRRFIEASREIHEAAFPPVVEYEKLSGERIPAHLDGWGGGAA